MTAHPFGGIVHTMRDFSDDERSCRVCGCTDNDACVNEVTGAPCHWVEDDLCSECVGKSPRRDRSHDVGMPMHMRSEELFPITGQLLEAGDDSVRAGLLLRIPDQVLAARASELISACGRCDFAMGQQFLVVRSAALSALRDRHGKLPEAHANTLEIWRRGMVALSERRAR